MQILLKARLFLDRLRAEWAPEASSVTTIDQPTAAIGDIHGRADLFHALLDKIRTHAAEQNVKPRLVLLGDYVDRGPASAEVLQTVINLKASEDWSEVITLRGNHEATLLSFLHDASVGATWAEFGGRTTLISYGITPPSLRADAEEWEGVRLALQEAMPQDHVQMLHDTTLYYEAGDYLFVHAGLRPGVPPSLQDADTLLWIRAEFLMSERAYDKVVVHGHTPEEAVHNSAWRIGLDTGAYASGTLSAVWLEKDSRNILQVGTTQAV